MCDWGGGPYERANYHTNVSDFGDIPKTAYLEEVEKHKEGERSAKNLHSNNSRDADSDHDLPATAA
jgi:hypothetical protein